MKHRAGALAMSLLLGAALFGQSLTATANGTTTVGQSDGPEVDPLVLKEAVRLIGKSQTKNHHHVPGTQRRGSSSTHRAVARRPKTLSEIQTETTDEQLHRLNDSVCSRLPDGTIHGPTRCKAWFDYLDSKNRRDTARKAIDDIRTQIQQQTVDIPLPKLTVRVQPAGRTLVNLDTIVYTSKKTQTRVPITLLGYPVTVVGTPVSYTWHFGDGTPDLTTTSPGSPYPAKEITHKYFRKGDVKLSVTVNYAAAFSIGGSQPMPIAGTLAITGPQTPLKVREAVPVLVEPER